MFEEFTDYQVKVNGEWDTHAFNVTPAEIARLRANVPSHWREGAEYRFRTEIIGPDGTVALRCACRADNPYCACQF